MSSRVARGAGVLKQGLRHTRGSHSPFTGAFAYNSSTTATLTTSTAAPRRAIFHQPFNSGDTEIAVLLSFARDSSIPGSFWHRVVMVYLYNGPRFDLENRPNGPCPICMIASSSCEPLALARETWWDDLQHTPQTPTWQITMVVTSGRLSSV